MNEYDEKWEQQINALLDGELGETDTEALKSAAGDDRELARAIVEAHRLQQAMEVIGIERAPASLRKRLNAIPRQQKSASGIGWLQPRWAMALAAVPLVLISLSLMQPKAPSAAEIAKARQDLAIAFAYLDKAGQFTSREIESTVGHTMSDAIAGSVIRNIKSQNEPLKEKEV
jgi:anti-sigma factor RsiW